MRNFFPPFTLCRVIGYVFNDLVDFVPIFSVVSLHLECTYFFNDTLNLHTQYISQTTRYEMPPGERRFRGKWCPDESFVGKTLLCHDHTTTSKLPVPRIVRCHRVFQYKNSESKSHTNTGTS